MSSSFLRNTSIYCLLRIHSSPTTISAHSILKHPMTTTTEAESGGSYHRFSYFFKKSTRECDGISPSPLTFPFSPSSSSWSSTASLSKIGLVGWYFGMLKSKPILTKSITSSCIYTAANLSSQTLYGPLMTAVFFSLNGWLQGENNAEVVAWLKRDLPQTLLNGVMYWPVCDFITFKFFPVYLQLLSLSYIGLLTSHLAALLGVLNGNHLQQTC